MIYEDRLPRYINEKTNPNNIKQFDINTNQKLVIWNVISHEKLSYFAFISYFLHEVIDKKKTVERNIPIILSIVKTQ